MSEKIIRGWLESILGKCLTSPGTPYWSKLSLRVAPGCSEEQLGHILSAVIPAGMFVYNFKILTQRGTGGYWGVEVQYTPSS